MLRRVLRAAVGTDLEYEEEPPPQNEIFYTEASPKLRAARIAVRDRPPGCALACRKHIVNMQERRT